MAQLREYLLRYNVSPLGHTGLAVVVAAGRSQAENLLKAQGYYNAAKYTYNIEYCVLINNTDTFTSPALLDETIPIKGDQGPMGPRGYTGATGKQGIPGNPGKDGIDGIGISSTSVTYGVSNSIDSLPKSWTSSLPEVKEKSYLWTKVIFHYTNGEQKTIYSYTKQGYEGAKGDSVTITNILYSSSNSDTEIPDGIWVFDITLVKPNLYLWSKITFNDGSVLYNKIRQGQDGQTGPTGPKGDPGDPLTWDKMTLEQQESIKNDIEDNVVSEIGTKTFPKLTAGFANNLIGRGEATEEEFTYRPTNGKNSIEDEVARVTKIKGNSVVWNQHLNPTFIDSESSISLNDGGIPKGHRFALMRSVADGECYYIPSEGIFNYSLGTGEYAKIFTNSHDVDNDYVQVYSVGKSGYVQLIDLTKMFEVGNEPTTVEEFYARIPSGIDINAYNEGEIISMNTEAIKAVGFNQFNGSYARVIFGETYYLGGTYTNIGFTAEIGGVTQGITIPEDKLYKATQDGYIYAEGTDICINLSHTGWRNGEYEPYREFTRELPIIKKYFPDGMKKAGSAFDSIELDSSKQKWVAVQRIGSVMLSDLNWDYLSSLGHFYSYTPISDCINLGGIICPQYVSYYGPTAKMPNKSITISPYYGDKRVGIQDTDFTDVATFKTYLSENKVVAYYELAEPIVTEIEDEYLNFDYDAEDFGTEEALSSVPSAPFRADIIYKFNAVDSIRQNIDAIKDLQEVVNSLQLELMQLKATNNEAAIN